MDQGGKRPSLAVIIPLFNGRATIVAALDSVARQTVPVDEVIVVDDGSTDGGGTLVAGHPSAPTLITLTSNGGVARARNIGAFRASSDYIAFLDQDDLWMRTRVATILGLLVANPRWDAIVTGVSVFALERDRERLTSHPFHSWVEHWVISEDQLFDDRRPPAPVGAGHSTPVTLSRLLEGPISVTTTYVLRRSTFHEVGGCATWLRSADDWVLLQNLARFGIVVEIDDHTVLYRVHPENTSLNTDWGIPLLLSALALRNGRQLVGTDPKQALPPPIESSPFLMHLLNGLGAAGGVSRLAKATSISLLLATGRRDRGRAVASVCRSFVAAARRRRS